MFCFGRLFFHPPPKIENRILETLPVLHFFFAVVGGINGLTFYSKWNQMYSYLFTEWVQKSSGFVYSLLWSLKWIWMNVYFAGILTRTRPFINAFGEKMCNALASQCPCERASLSLFGFFLNEGSSTHAATFFPRIFVHSFIHSHSWLIHTRFDVDARFISCSSLGRTNRINGIKKCSSNED